jgi:hypothetical protein
MGSLLIDSDNEIEVLEICNEDSKTHSSIEYSDVSCNNDSKSQDHKTLSHSSLNMIHQSSVWCLQLYVICSVVDREQLLFGYKMSLHIFVIFFYCLQLHFSFSFKTRTCRQS